MALNKEDRILITGGTGLIGTNLYKRLVSEGYDAHAIGSEYDLRDPVKAKEAFETFRPTVVFHLAAKVGGIYANVKYKAAFYSDNVLINTNVVNECVRNNVRYVFAMGTGCGYPKRLEGSILEEKDFLDGIPENTNDAYAYAKRGLLVHLKSLSEQKALDYCYCLPANIYGPYDNFHPKHSHVMPGLIRRFCEAKENRSSVVTIWGKGEAKRDFLYIDDCIEAALILSKKGITGTVNVATGKSTTINTLASEIKRAIGFEGKIEHDMSFPEGQAERIFDINTIMSIGWAPKYSLKNGIRNTIEWFMRNKHQIIER